MLPSDILLPAAFWPSARIQLFKSSAQAEVCFETNKFAIRTSHVTYLRPISGALQFRRSPSAARRRLWYEYADRAFRQRGEWQSHAAVAHRQRLSQLQRRVLFFRTSEYRVNSHGKRLVAIGGAATRSSDVLRFQCDFRAEACWPHISRIDGRHRFTGDALLSALPDLRLQYLQEL